MFKETFLAANPRFLDLIAPYDQPTSVEVVKVGDWYKKMGGVSVESTKEVLDKEKTKKRLAGISRASSSATPSPFTVTDGNIGPELLSMTNSPVQRLQPPAQLTTPITPAPQRSPLSELSQNGQGRSLAEIARFATM
jgi:hypothetical protein